MKTKSTKTMKLYVKSIILSKKEPDDIRLVLPLNFPKCDMIRLEMS